MHRIALFLLLLFGGNACWAQLPELSLPDSEGQTRSLAEHRGKIVVLNFWATWCPPCLEEMPMLEKVFRKHGDRVVVIGASLDDQSTNAKIAPFLKKRKITFPIWLNATVEHMEALGLGEAVPATLFLDEEGRAVGRVLGQLKKRELNRRIEWMLGDRSGSEPPALENNLDSD